jgi:hypothetical protein
MFDFAQGEDGRMTMDMPYGTPTIKLSLSGNFAAAGILEVSAGGWQTDNVAIAANKLLKDKGFLI